MPGRFARGVGLVALGTMAGIAATVPANAAMASGAGAASVAAADTQAPTTPTDVMVSKTTSTSVTINWQWSTDNVDVVGYVMNINGQQVTLNQDWATYTFFGLTSGARYSITVAAFDAAGNTSAPSAPVVAITVKDTTAPTTPTNFRGAPGPDATFMWTESTDDGDLIIYTLYLDGQPVGEVYNANFIYMGDFEPTGTHTVFVRASDSAGNVSEPSNTVTFTL